MTELDAYEQRVMKLMTPPAQATGDPLVVGFDFVSILAMVIPILLPLLQSCGPKTPAQMADRLLGKDAWVRALTQRAVNQACSESGVKMPGSEKMRIAKAVLDGLGDKAEAIRLMAEIDAESKWGV